MGFICTVVIAVILHFFIDSMVVGGLVDVMNGICFPDFSAFYMRAGVDNLRGMDAPRYFQHAEGHAIFRPAGELKVVEVMEMVTGAISYARESGVRRLLAVLTDVTGMIPPNATVRYRYVREWAMASAGLVRLAAVTTADMIEPGRFGVTVAANAGMEANIFEDETEAQEWLMR